MEWTSWPMEKVHSLLKLSPTFQHGAKAIDDQHVSGMQHDDCLRIVTRPSFVVGSEERSQIDWRGLSD